MAVQAQWYRDRWASVPLELRARIVDVLRTGLDEATKAGVRERIRERGEDWLAEIHHGWGTAIRNLLRTSGFPDHVLPDAPYEHIEGTPMARNWDDYYMQAVEAALLAPEGVLGPDMLAADGL